MSQEEINVSHMQCWLFRMSQQKWAQSAEDLTKIFREYDVFGYIAECYDLFHLSSYAYALNEIETFLNRKGVTVCRS